MLLHIPWQTDHKDNAAESGQLYTVRPAMVSHLGPATRWVIFGESPSFSAEQKVSSPRCLFYHVFLLQNSDEIMIVKVVSKI